MEYRIQKEYVAEDPLYYHINQVKIDEKEGDMVKVYDIHDGVSFWINFSKLEPCI